MNGRRHPLHVPIIVAAVGAGLLVTCALGIYLLAAIGGAR